MKKLTAPRFLVTTERTGQWRPAKRLMPYLWQHRSRVLIGLVFLVAAKLANISVPLTLKAIVDHLQPAAHPTAIILATPIALLIAYGALRFSTILFNEIRNVVFARASLHIIHAISTQVLQHLFKLSLGFHLDRKTGGLSRDVERGTMAITNFLRIFVFSILPVVLEITLVLYILGTRFDQRFVVITLLMIAIYSAFTLSMTRWRTRFRVEMNQADSAASTQSLDSLINYETVKVFGNEHLEQKRYSTTLLSWVRASLDSNLSLAYLNAGQGLIVASGLAILLLLAADGVTQGNLTLGDFVMVNAFLIQLYIPLNFLGSVYRDLNHSLIDMQRLFDLLDQTPDVIEHPHATPLNLKRGQIEFIDVSFAYQPSKLTLKHINLVVPGGKMVAVVGPSGSGKSTLARLLLRFYNPKHGHIRIDGQDIQHVTLDSLRRVLGVVPQDTVLFNDTIRYNIGYARADASQDEIEAVAKLAQLDEFIRQHPEGYDILVGERGLKLSGGEKQRVSIARTALKQARILIFDEATSSLDSRSEQAIQTALERVAKDTTTLVIAHRLSTIVKAHHIVVLDQGSIVEQGNHDELLKQQGLYAQMWQIQQRERDG